MPPSSEIYQQLIIAAHRKKSVTYAKLAALAGLDTSQPSDRKELGEILGAISTYEHENGRPLLSVVAWYSGKSEPSDGFYKLADSLGIYSKGQDKDTFFITELNKAYDFWSTTNLHIADIEITTDEYKSALLADGVLKDKTTELLKLFFDAPNQEATAPDISAHFGYSHHVPANGLIGNFGWRVAQFLQILNPLNEQWWQVVADGEERPNGFTWRLRENLSAALIELNLISASTKTIYPETLAEDEIYTEGTKKTVIVNAYERNSKAREACIAHYGAVCSVCNMDFSKVYGDIGHGFIHVHHVVELSTIQEEYQVDPVMDLRPVCPNCHAMLHTAKPALTIEELQRLMKESS